MFERTTRLRWRRLFRKRKRQVEGIGVQAEEQVDRLFFRRLNRLVNVRRFILSWVLLVVLLIGGLVVQTRALTNYYQKLAPVPGGTMTEGILGSYTNASPLYATDAVDSAVSRLLFSGLFRYDVHNKLVGDLAEKWEVDQNELVYTVHLRHGVNWHDDQPFTADDVVYTYHTLQNPDAKSPLFSSWQKVVIAAVDPYTVTFTLPSPLSSFPNSLTNGIVPQHILKDVPVTQLRSIRFDSVEPIGTGPFKLSRVEVAGTTPETRTEQVTMVANKHYYGSVPKLDQYIIRSYRSESQLTAALKDREITAASGLNTIPDDVRTMQNINELSIPLTAEVMVFFKASNEVLGDVKVRQALIKAADQKEIIQSIGYPVIAARSPFLKSHVGYNPQLTQFDTNVEEAKKILDDAGWKINDKGYRAKGDQQLQFKLYAQNRTEYAAISQKLQMQWKAIGVQADVLLQPDSDLQGTVANHSYDALLYGISLGTDPDVYAYWHSSQADIRSLTRLNLSEYKSTTADKALEAGRSRSDASLRTVKYKPFLENWRNDAPAMALYQPRYLYVTRGTIYNFDETEMNSAIDRYANVEQWMVTLARVNK